MLIQLGISYDSNEAVETARDVMNFIDEESKKVSHDLAQRRGTFPTFDGSIHNDGNPEHSYRNATTTTVAPTGTISIIAGASSGIEPNFDLGYTHTDAEGQKKLFYNKYLEGELQKAGLPEDTIATVMKRIIVNGESLQSMDEIPDRVKRLFVTTNDISPEWHLAVQATFQEHTDNAVSKTLNLPNRTTKEEILQIYKEAYRRGCKGVTVYRKGSREVEVLKSPSGGLEHKLIDVERPPQVEVRDDSDTYTIRTGEGKLHVTITGDKSGYAMQVFENLGPIGTGKSTSASVDGLRLTRYLQDAEEPNLLEILVDYGSAKSDSPIGFGPNRVDSIQHGLAIVWRYHLLRHGIIEQDKETGLLKQVVFKDGKKQEEKILEERKVQNPACPKCGSRNTHFAEGCKEPICRDCGENKCS